MTLQQLFSLPDKATIYICTLAELKLKYPNFNPHNMELGKGKIPFGFNNLMLRLLGTSFVFDKDSIIDGSQRGTRDPERSGIIYSDWSWHYSLLKLTPATCTALPKL